MNLESYIAARSPLVERFLDAQLPAAETPPVGLHAAMRHLLFPGGKRLRPLLALAAAEAVGGRAEAALRAACAVELIHTYSLIHDDLPCMDDDAQRRGRPTVHVAFGESTAVLAGDALLAEAFRVLCSDVPPADAGRCLGAAADLAHAASSRQLVGGQADDLELAGRRPHAAAIEAVHRRKTAALIAAAVVAGARLAGAAEPWLERLARFGVALGLAFQIADDLIDAGDDAGGSLVRALGPDAARGRAAQLLESALGEIAGLDAGAEPLRALARRAVWRER